MSFNNVFLLELLSVGNVDQLASYAGGGLITRAFAWNTDGITFILIGSTHTQYMQFICISF